MSTTLNNSRVIHKGRVFNVLCDNITLENGRSVDMDIIRHPGAAAMVALDQDKNVILLKQYRYAVDQYIWEIPAGTLDDGESGLACAQRELIEEAGVRAETWHKLGEIVPVPGYSDECIQIFLALDLKPDTQSLDADEVLAPHKFPFSKALDMIYTGDIMDAKSIAGLSLTAHWLQAAGRI